MMLCQECRRNEANIHIIKNMDGKQSELNLCEQCARKKEELDFSFEPQFSLHKLFAGMLEQGLFDSREEKMSAKRQCSSCGLTFAQFSQIGRLGCDECFVVFKDKLKPLLRRIHGNCIHSGKIPVRAQARVNFIREMDQLQEVLQLKVQNEEFEEAVLLRDRIREIESKIRLDETEKGDPK